MIPYIDNSGPTLTINVSQRTCAGQESEGYKLLLSMLDGTVTSPFPRFATAALENKGVFHCEYYLFI